MSVVKFFKLPCMSPPQAVGICYAIVLYYLANMYSDTICPKNSSVSGHKNTDFFFQNIIVAHHGKHDKTQLNRRVLWDTF